MRMVSWENIPSYMHNKEVKSCFNILKRKALSLALKRLFDVVLSLALILVLSPVLLLISLLIKLDSRGTVLYKQVRITQFGRRFIIYKFRTMRDYNMVKSGFVYVYNMECEKRITRIGRLLRKYRLDELPQLFNILTGDMTFVGTRPEVPEYVAHYTDKMYATLLLPAGLTSIASIEFSDEDEVLSGMSSEEAEAMYISTILPQKMELNLRELKDFSLLADMKVLAMTCRHFLI